MNKTVEILKSKRGNSTLWTVTIILILLMIFCCISKYLHLLIIAKGVREAVQSAVVSTVIENYDDVYHAVREGYSGGYIPVGEIFEQSLDYGDVQTRLDNLLGLTLQGEYHSHLIHENKEEYRLSKLSVDIQNIPFASASIHQQLGANCSILLEVPVSFGRNLLPPMKMQIKTKAGYVPKF